MRRTWPFLVALVTFGVVAGISIAGRPVRSDPLVVAPPVSTTSTAPPASTAPPLTEAPTTVAPAPTTTGAPATTIATTTVPTTTTTTTTTTVAPPTSPAPTTTTPARNRDEVRVVVANGSGQSGLAKVVAGQLRTLGYVGVTAANGTKAVPTTTIYFTPGFEPEARRLAVDLGLPEAAIEPLPEAGVTAQRVSGDVVTVLGSDARQ